MLTELQKVKAIIEEIEPDFDRFYNKKNKSAGRRVRKGLQEIRKLSQDIRMDILEKSK